MRLLVSLLFVLVAVPAHAARVVVRLPEEAALRVVDRDHPDRISCPPTCVYDAPGTSIGIFELKVDVENDPRTNNPPWNIVAMNGCRGTSGLPATNGLCRLPTEGDATISFELSYRPIVAVTFAGAVGGPLGHLFVTAAPGSEGSAIDGFACDALSPHGPSCAQHEPFGHAIALSAPSTNQATLEGVSPPCGGATCNFAIPGDTCIAYLYRNGDPGFFPTVSIGGPECPAGPGIGGGGGGGGGGPTPAEEALRRLKNAALEQMRNELQQALPFCGSAAFGLSLLAVPGGLVGPVIGTTIVTVSSPICVIYVHRLSQLTKIYNDPPDLAFDTIAPITPTARPAVALPSCADLTGADRRTCRQVQKGVLRYLAKAQRTDDITETLRITVERASAALQANEERALKRQLRAGEKRLDQLEAAIAARARAGAKLAGTLAAAGTTGPFTEAQFAETSAIVLGKLGEQGVPQSEVQTLLGSALTPRALDLLAVLGEP